MIQFSASILKRWLPHDLVLVCLRFIPVLRAEAGERRL
uniref:Uncharacterized protein n=1 Tax=Siphoviridae sp. ctDEW4 TaxID=2823569 RepID=A0A8S5L7J2_9CAUD|nr:MAG TPA: hypothetical protein [Siphoviridae sp. ctDEW4]